MNKLTNKTLSCTEFCCIKVVPDCLLNYVATVFLWDLHHMVDPRRLIWETKRLKTYRDDGHIVSPNDVIATNFLLIMHGSLHFRIFIYMYILASVVFLQHKLTFSVFQEMYIFLQKNTSAVIVCTSSKQRITYFWV